MTVTGLAYNDPGYLKAWRDLHKDRLAANRKVKYWTTGKARYIRRSYWINKYKTAKGCQECGYNKHAVALDFDHVTRDVKSFDVCKRIPNATLRSLFAEIRKCQILCANCHRIKTLEERQFEVSRTT